MTGGSPLARSAMLLFASVICCASALHTVANEASDNDQVPPPAAAGAPSSVSTTAPKDSLDGPTVPPVDPTVPAVVPCASPNASSSNVEAVAKRVFARIDANADGSIDAAEMHRFQSFVTDYLRSADCELGAGSSNNVIVRDGALVPLAFGEEQDRKLAMEDAEALFASIDTDRNRRVTRSELLRFRQLGMALRFQKERFSQQAELHLTQQQDIAREEELIRLKEQSLEEKNVVAKAILRARNIMATKTEALANTTSLPPCAAPNAPPTSFTELGDEVIVETENGERVEPVGGAQSMPNGGNHRGAALSTEGNGDAEDYPVEVPPPRGAQPPMLKAMDTPGDEFSGPDEDQDVEDYSAFEKANDGPASLLSPEQQEEEFARKAAGSGTGAPRAALPFGEDDDEEMRAEQQAAEEDDADLDADELIVKNQLKAEALVASDQNQATMTGLSDQLHDIEEAAKEAATLAATVSAREDAWNDGLEEDDAEVHDAEAE
eukprot:TRINITY_DN9466_c0_g1_i2.p1 TRINITY_DN9466_c0_g1~~TRINITY_DN9466_c0_g1_i2.p1  ORF type:complete len:518 (+),score=129.03 TRINITY_DN9466_c0_g1_i2:77-1555(+)